MDQKSYYQAALQDFQQARMKANLRELSARLRGEPVHLLSYDEVRSKLKANAVGKPTLKDIPVIKIVGSVNRYEDFTSDFLPRSTISASRWSNVSAARDSLNGLPPIEAYQIGDVYFVNDGNHRVSIARQYGWPTIQGYVTEIHSRIPITSEITSDKLIVKSEYIKFLEYCNIDQLRRGANLDVTAPGKYLLLQEHISIHRYYMGLERKREIPLQEAVIHWYDNYYTPIVEVIRRQGLLKDFPGRTETDLYLWIIEHRSALEKELGECINEVSAAIHLASQVSSTPKRLISRLLKKIKKWLVPESLDSGPPVGSWREERHLMQDESSHLVESILVPINGKPDDWTALDQALIIANKEQASINCLHTISRSLIDTSDRLQSIQDYFKKRCSEYNIQGNFITVTGDMNQNIIDRAAWNDLVVINRGNPRKLFVTKKIDHEFRNLVLQCPRPILVTSNNVAPLQRALLAYDGSPKSNEALYLSAYLAGKWQIDLTVLTIAKRGVHPQSIQESASQLLNKYHVQASFLQESGPTDTTILVIAEENNCDFIIMGGYGSPPLVNALQDSSVDRLIRSARRSILLCR